MAEKVKCIYCGQMHKADAIFCSITGKKLSKGKAGKVPPQPTMMIKPENPTQPFSNPRQSPPGNTPPQNTPKSACPPESERCPLCGGFHKKNAKFCNVTGEKIYRKTCPSCRQEVLLRKPDGKFCPLCGKNLLSFCPYEECKASLSSRGPFCVKCFQKIQYCLSCNNPAVILQKQCPVCKKELPPAAGEWLTFNGSGARTGFSRAELSFPLFIKWSFPRNDEDSHIISNLLIWRGTLFAGDYEGNLHALNQYSGKLKWTRPARFPIISTPAIDEESLYMATAEGKLFALDATNGRILWTYPRRGEEVIAPIEASVLLGRGKIYIAPRMAQKGQLLALDKTSGSLLWEFSENTVSGDSLGIKVSPAIDQETLVVATTMGFVYGIDADSGKLLWRFPKDRPLGAQINASPSISDGIAYITDRSGRMFALRMDTGEDTWHFSTEVEGSINSSLAVGSSSIFVGTWAAYLYCLDKCAGGMRWRYQNDKISVWDSISAAPLILNDRAVVFGSASGYVYALDMSGNDLWKYRLESEIISSPVVSDGFLYVVTDSGRLYAFYPRSAEKG